jgi:hypothetical protein
VNGNDDWVLDPQRLDEALAGWRAQQPDAQSRRQVNEFLMDLVLAPMECSQPDEHDVWSGWAGSDARRILIIYNIDLERRRIFVIDIAFWNR